MVNGIAQKPIEGVSMAYTFDKANANAPSRARRSISRCSPTARSITTAGSPRPLRRLRPGSWARPKCPRTSINGYKWELYNLKEDYSEYNDLAAKMPDKLREMQELFMVEATKYNVFPLDNSILPRVLTPRPSATAGRNVFTYAGEMSGLPAQRRPEHPQQVIHHHCGSGDPAGRTWPLGPRGAEGMLVTMGGRFGGYGLYLLKGKPVFLYNILDLEALSLGRPGGAHAGQAHHRV